MKDNKLKLSDHALTPKGPWKFERYLANSTSIIASDRGNVPVALVNRNPTKMNSNPRSSLFNDAIYPYGYAISDCGPSLSLNVGIGVRIFDISGKHARAKPHDNLSAPLTNTRPVPFKTEDFDMVHKTVVLQGSAGKTTDEPIFPYGDIMKNAQPVLDFNFGLGFNIFPKSKKKNSPT